MNRGILERDRSMKIHVGLDLLATLGSCYGYNNHLIKRSPSSALDGDISEMWYDKIVNYYFLKVFGYIAYAHVDQEMRKKLENKSQKCALIWYGGDEYDYRLWNYEQTTYFEAKTWYSMRLACTKAGWKKRTRKQWRDYMELDELKEGKISSSENGKKLLKKLNKKF